MNERRVLFVEDNRHSSLIGCTFLREAGYDVVEAFDARAATDIIDRRDELFALVTDINLGPGEDGFDVARHARIAYPDLPVIFVSAAAGSRMALEAVDLSVFLAKPYRPLHLMEALGRA